MTTKTGRPVGRPPDPDKGDVIVAAAWDLFLAHGVEGTTVEAIAERAGVSKATLYKLYPDKGALFVACIEREMLAIEAAQNLGPDTADGAGLADVLRNFGIGVMSFIVSDYAVAFYNALAGELSRHETMARDFYEMGPGRTRSNLAAILKAGAERGELRLADPEEAAEHLFGLWQGFSNFQLSLGVESAQIRDKIAERVDRGLSVFMAAYGASASRGIGQTEQHSQSGD